jgi:hypothetical protein
MPGLARAGQGDARAGQGDARAGQGDARAMPGLARVMPGLARAGLAGLSFSTNIKCIRPCGKYCRSN